MNNSIAFFFSSCVYMFSSFWESNFLSAGHWLYFTVQMVLTSRYMHTIYF